MEQAAISHRAGPRSLRRVLLLLPAVLLAANGPVSRQGVPPPEKCADRVIASVQEEWGIPGLAIAVLRDGEVLYRATRGVADVESGAPVSPATLFQLSSTAKLFTGVLVMRLVERGLLDLDAPVGEYLADVPGTWNSVTLRHCLDHTCGLFEVTTMEGLEKGTVDVATAMKTVYAESPTPTPGETFAYCNTGYLIVGLVVEAVTGKAFAEVMREEVFAPAGMSSATFWESSEAPPPGAATDYYPADAGGLAPRRFRFPPFMWPAGGLASSLDDLIRFGTALARGRLVSEASLEIMWEPVRLNDGSTVSYGLGWDTKTHAEAMFSAGHEGGMLTTLRIYPSQELTVIVLTDGFSEKSDPDVLATAVAAVWEPEIVGLAARPCSSAELEKGEF